MSVLFAQVFDAITQWPVIAQGAMGSALFAAISYFGQKALRKTLSGFAKFNKNFRKENLYRELVHKKHRRTDFKQLALMVSIYQAFGYIARGLIFLALGWLFDGIIPLALTIGVLGFLFYAFRAVLWIDNFKVESKETELEIWERIREIEIELNGNPEADTVAKLAKLKSA